MNELACMGGWCSRRESCPHYLAEDRSEPAERLCEPGRDGVMLEFVPCGFIPEQPVEWPELEAA
jgi:hypothetical protein